MAEFLFYAMVAPIAFGIGLAVGRRQNLRSVIQTCVPDGAGNTIIQSGGNTRIGATGKSEPRCEYCGTMKGGA